MSFLSKLFPTRSTTRPLLPVGDLDDGLNLRLREAKRRHDKAVSSLVEASHKQERDAKLARQIVHDVLRRVETKVTAQHLERKP